MHGLGAPALHRLVHEQSRHGASGLDAIDEEPPQLEETPMPKKSKGQSVSRFSRSEPRFTYDPHSPEAIAKAALYAGESIHQWLEEVNSWPWPGAFVMKDVLKSDEPLEPEARRASRNGSVQRRRATKISLSGYASLPENLILHYSDRVDELRAELDEIRLDDQKAFLLETSQKSLKNSSENLPTSVAAAEMDAFAAVAIDAVMQTIALHAKFTSAIKLWSARTLILRQIRPFLIQIDELRDRLDAAWRTIGRPEKSYYLDDSGLPVLGTHGVFRNIIDTVKADVASQLTDLTRELDRMLDTLDGLEETIPEDWIDDVERIEEDFKNWTVEAAASADFYESRGDAPLLHKPTAVTTEPQQVVKTQRIPGEWLDDNILCAIAERKTRRLSPKARLPAYHILQQHLRQKYKPLPYPYIPPSRRRSHSRKVSTTRRIASIRRMLDIAPKPIEIPGKKRPTSKSTDSSSVYSDNTPQVEKQNPLNGTSTSHTPEAPLNRWTVSSRERGELVTDINTKSVDNHSQSSSRSFSLGEPGPEISTVLSVVDARPLQNGMSPCSTPPSAFSEFWMRDSSNASNDGSASTDISSVPSLPEENAKHYMSDIKCRKANCGGAISSTNSSVRPSPRNSIRRPRPASAFVQSTMLHESSREEALGKVLERIVRSLPITVKLEQTPSRAPPRDSLLAAETPLKPNHFQAYKASKASELPTLTIRAAHVRDVRSPLMYNNSDIKLYYLCQSDRQSAVKLFIRLSSTDSGRIAVRLGQDWADLGDYLQRYIGLCMLHTKATQQEALVATAATDAVEEELDEVPEELPILRERLPFDHVNRSMPRPLSLNVGAATATSNRPSNRNSAVISPASPSSYVGRQQSLSPEGPRADSAMGWQDSSRPTSRTSQVQPIRMMCGIKNTRDSLSNIGFRASPPSVNRIQPFTKGTRASLPPGQLAYAGRRSLESPSPEEPEPYSQRWIEYKMQRARQQWETHAARLSEDHDEMF